MKKDINIMLRFVFRTLFHLIVTAIGVLMIVFGVQNNNIALWIWGIVVIVVGNLCAFFLLFLIGLLMIPAARRQDSCVGANKNDIHNRVKYCKQCGKEVEYTIMICPNCGNKTYSDEAPKEIKAEK